MKTNHTLEELEYELNLEKAVARIKKQKAKRVLLQLPDGLKLWATQIASHLREKSQAEIFIWFGSCFGACDVPNIPKEDFDLIIQLGHSEWE